ncbi:hypothetical protein FFF34_016975 [Inquilinus sp. KBS0705]|nr:hypothetical protein FFF34_016975 [Inquilinus sp. KBS0705]
MLLEFFEVIVMLALIILPLAYPKRKPKHKAELKVNTDTHDSEYAVNENGKLERITWHAHN